MRDLKNELLNFPDRKNEEQLRVFLAEKGINTIEPLIIKALEKAGNEDGLCIATLQSKFPKIIETLNKDESNNIIQKFIKLYTYDLHKKDDQKARVQRGIMENLLKRNIFDTAQNDPNKNPFYQAYIKAPYPFLIKPLLLQKPDPALVTVALNHPVADHRLEDIQHENKHDIDQYFLSLGLGVEESKIHHTSSIELTRPRLSKPKYIYDHENKRIYIKYSEKTR